MHAFPSSQAVVVGAAAATQHPAEHVLIMQGAAGWGQSPSFAHTLGEHPPELDALDALDVELLDVELLDVELLDVLDVELLDVADTVELLDAVAPAIPAAPPPPPPLAPPVPKRTASVPQAGMAHSAPSQSRMINIA